jgi:acetyltransferase-like isoleucine patch superfamily enzyme
MMRLLLILVKNIWWFTIPPFKGIRNWVFTRYYKAANKMSVGKYVSLGTAHPNDMSSLKIGRDFEMGSFGLIDCSGGVEIEDGVTLSEGVKIYTHNHTITDRNISWRSQPIKFSTLKIGEGAWVGASTIILESVSYIGKGAVIGAGSVVVKDIPDYAIAVGNPARVIKMRGE